MDGIKNWAGGSTSHGNPRVVGELPEGIPLRDISADTLSPEAQAFLDMLTDAVSGEIAAVIRPHGSKTEVMANDSSAWQVFSELVTNRDRAACRVWNGTDGMLGSQGGAPGVDISVLFGVASTIVQSDLQCIEDAFYTAVSVPWTAMNYGTSRLAPRLKYQLPDPDAEKQRDIETKASDAFFKAIENYKKNGFRLTQDVVNRLAANYGVAPPELKQGMGELAIDLASSDIAKFIRGKEARQSRGLPPFGDERDELTLLQLETWVPPPSVTPAPIQTPEA